MRSTRLLIPAAAFLAAISIATAASGQSLQDRIARIDGDVRFSFTPKPGVCGDGGGTIFIREDGRRRTVTISGSSFTTTDRKYADEWDPSCEEGPARIALTTADGRVSSLRTYVGGSWRATAGVTDLGLVSGNDAADFLLATAERATGRVASGAMFAASLADGAETSRRLLRIARNESVSRDVRKNAIFWLGQQAGDAVTRGLQEIIESQEELEIREQAIFALSQRPSDESVPVLISLIRRDNVDPRLKKTALFWLGQKDDPRAIALIEEILTKR